MRASLVLAERRVPPRFVLLCFFVMTGMCSAPISKADAIVDAPVNEIVRSIYDFDIEYQERARAAVEEKMYHVARDSYIRWRPVRIVHSEVLREEIASDNALPTWIQLTVFADVVVRAQRTRYTYHENAGAFWEGVIPGVEHSKVEVSIVDEADKLLNTEERIAFVVRISIPHRMFYIHPTDEPDVYVAIEGVTADNQSRSWAPNN